MTQSYLPTKQPTSGRIKRPTFWPDFCIWGAAWVAIAGIYAYNKPQNIQQPSAQVMEAKQAVQSDLIRLSECGQLNAERQPQQWRDCLMAKASNLNTVQGHTALASKARTWLAEHPEDKEMQKMGLSAINSARTLLASARGLDSATLGDGDAAGAAGIQPEATPERLFESAVVLNKLQLEIMVPDLHKEQYDWMVRISGYSYADKNTAPVTDK